MSATPKAAYLRFALSIDHGVLYVRLNTSHQSFKETLTKAFFFFVFFPKQLRCQHTHKWEESESVERCYYAKRAIMMILMIMVMNVHNLFPLSVKTMLAQTGEKMGA